MATYSWRDIDIILVDGYNVQPMTVIDITIPNMRAGIEKLHGAGEEWGTALSLGTKMVDGDVTLRMPLDTNAKAAFVTAAHVTDGVCAVGLEGNTLGAPVYFYKAHQLDYSQEPGPEVSTKIAAMWTVNGQVYQGKVLVPWAAKTADGNSEGTSVDNGASTATGGTAVLEVTDLTLGGHDGLSVAVSHSADNVTFVPLVTFTTLTAKGAEIKATAAVTTTVNRYLAASWDFTGAGSPTAGIFVAFYRGQ